MSYIGLPRSNGRLPIEMSSDTEAGPRRRWTPGGVRRLQARFLRRYVPTSGRPLVELDLSDHGYSMFWRFRSAQTFFAFAGQLPARSFCETEEFAEFVRPWLQKQQADPDVFLALAKDSEQIASEVVAATHLVVARAPAVRPDHSTILGSA